MAYFDRFRRLLVVLDLERELELTLSLAEWLAPLAERVHCLCLPDVQRELEAPERTGSAVAERLEKALSALQARRLGLEVTHALEAGLNATSIAKHADQLSADLVVLAPLRAHSARERAGLMLRLATRHRRHVLSVGARIHLRGSLERPPRRLVLAADADAASLPALADFVAELPDGVQISALLPNASEVLKEEVFAMFEAREPNHVVAVHGSAASTTDPAERIDAFAREQGADLVVGAADAVSDFQGLALGFLAGGALQQASRPFLLLPRTQASAFYLRERLAASDALLTPRGDPRVALEHEGAFGRIALLPEESVHVIEHGAGHVPLPHSDGVVSLPRAWFADDARVHVIVLETQGPLRESAAAHLLRPAPDRPLILIDAALHELSLSSVVERARTHQLVFVRMRRDEALHDVREKLAAYRTALDHPWLLDASAWLDDGGAEDVPSMVDGQRLLRVALRIMASGLAVQAVVSKEQHLRSDACQVLTAREWEAFEFESDRVLAPEAGAAVDADAALRRELDLSTSTRPVAGHRVCIEFDNAAARKLVVRLIEEARERVHWQCYIVEDDAVTAEVVHALQAAAARGVKVLFLADAVYSLHEAFGQKNTLLSQLATTPGVEVRAFRPVTFLPSVAALKRRNHRKCIVVDGHTAVVTGRNLGAPYYRGFSEVRLTPLSSYREVPWLDCDAVFDGPLVSELERAFAHEWTRAGGDPQVIEPSPSTGQLAARLVLHEGLRDTHTFDAQLALIRHAERELVIVNNFPLVVELQRALVAAIARGVRVRVLIGSVRPHFGDEQAFAGGTIRSVADQLVRSRLDAVVLAGGEVYEYALPALPDSDPDLGRVFPHVHAKLLLRDRKDVAVGSANLDVTAAYWESEALLIVHDPAFAAGVHDQLEALFASSRSVDPRTEKFKSDASQRAWLARYWPSLIG